METKTYNVFKFDELPPASQKLALEKYRDINTEHDWYSPIYEDFIKGAAALGFTVSNNDIHFSGFYSQGDGASFTTTYIDLIKFCATQKIKLNKKLKTLIEDEAITATIRRTSHHYSHHNTVTAEVNYSWAACAVIDATESKEGETVSQIETTMKKVKNDLCQKLYKDLETEYEGLTSDEAVKETLIVNDYLFTEDGCID